MAFTPRGLRLLKFVENYKKEKPNNFDSSLVLSKLNIQSASEGHLQADLVVDDVMCNSLDFLHGGYMSAVMDVAATFGQMSHAKGTIGWTTGFNINYISSAKIGDRISVETKPLLLTSRQSIIEATLRNQDAQLVAKGTLAFVPGNQKIQDIIRQKYGGLDDD